MELLKDLHQKTNITPNILARIAIGLSLRNPNPIEPTQEVDSMGLEFNRATLTGEFDSLFKALISQHAKHQLEDSDYFPTYINLHIERGTPLLSEEYNYAGNYEKFIVGLTRMGVESP